MAADFEARPVSGDRRKLHQRGPPIRLGIEQSLRLAHIPAENAHGIRQLSAHIRLSDPDADWLLCLG